LDGARQYIVLFISLNKQLSVTSLLATVNRVTFCDIISCHRDRQLCPFTFCDYKCFNAGFLPNNHVTKGNEFQHIDGGLFHHCAT